MQMLEGKLSPIISEIKTCLKLDLHFSALTLSLTMPDICSSIENPQEWKVGKRYKEWLNNYFFSIHDYKLKLSDGEVTLMEAGDIYALRCAYLHNGSHNLENHKSRNILNKFQFVHVGQKNNYYHKLYWTNIIHGEEYRTLMLDVDTFCNDIIDAVINFILIHDNNSQINLNAKNIKHSLNTDRIIFLK